MKSAVGILLGLCFSLLFLSPAAFAEKPLLKLKGSYFAYSYDLNQVYGENVEFEFLGYHVTGRAMMITCAAWIAAMNSSCSR